MSCVYTLSFEASGSLEQHCFIFSSVVVALEKHDPTPVGGEGVQNNVPFQDLT